MVSNLPTIKEKEKIISKRIRISESLEKDINDFASFYEGAKGHKPDENALIAAVLNDYFESNAAFKKFKKQQSTGQKPVKDAKNAEVTA